MSEISALEALETCRAMRYLKPDPIPDALVEKVIYGATRASNPGNSQGWHFIVVRDAGQRERIQQAIARGVGSAIGDTLAAQAPSAVEGRTLAGAQHLIENLHRAPVVVVVCARACYPPQAPSMQMVWCTVYTAAQNLIVTARALGLGSVFTTFNLQADAELREILDLPDDVVMGNVIPLGWPERAFGPLARKPVEEVIHHDRWQPGR